MLIAMGVAPPLGAGRPAWGAGGIEHAIVFVQQRTPGGAPGADGAGGGSRIVRLDPGGSFSILSEGFFEAADPCVSFDARRLVFAGRQASSDPWDIWEMDADGSNPTRITRDLGDCREPIYLPRAAVDSPDFKDKVRWITFTSTAPGALDEEGVAPLTSLYAMNLEPVPNRGTVLWRTTYNLGGDACPTLLSDGRVLFSARQRGSFALMAISWSGENLNPLYGSHDEPISQVAACELPDRRVLFVESETASASAGGRLSTVSLRRPLHTHEVIGSDGLYRTPHPLPEGGVLVAWKTGTGSYGVHLFDFQHGAPGREIYDDPGWDDVDPICLAPRPEPPGRIPTVEFASVLDVGSFREIGQLQCLNVYDSDRPGASQVELGSIKSVRLVQGIPREIESTGSSSPPIGSSFDAAGSSPGSSPPPASAAPASPAPASPGSVWPPPGVDTRPLGEAPVEEDGSFYVNVAGDVPFYIETLNERGEVVQTMRTWIWVRSGGQRGCVGCHEDKELAPENRATQALIRARPTTLTGGP